MKGKTRLHGRQGPSIHRLRGMVTVYTCLMVLVFLALVMSYTTTASITEQKSSAAEVSQKQAFLAAESGMALAREWLLANNVLIHADVEDMLSGGLDGWFVTGSKRWKRCGDVNYANDPSHPCWADPIDERRDDRFFYYWNGSTKLPIDTSVLNASGVEVSVEALYCLIDLDLGILPGLSSLISGCLTNPALVDGSQFLITLLARGGAECSNGSCKAEALVSEQISNFRVVASTRIPGVPLITKTGLPTFGIPIVSGNPNGGGLNLPLSVWANGNLACGGETIPEDEPQPTQQCSLVGGLLGSGCLFGVCVCTILPEIIDPVLDLLDVFGSGLLLDAAFPCDLFEYFLGVPRDKYRTLRDSVTVIDDCSVLDEDSFGTYWVTGPICSIAANQVVGSAKHPVTVISAAAITQMASGSELYGVLMVTDVENASAEFRTTGNSTIHGALISEGLLGPINGNFRLNYDEDIVADASASAGLGDVTGSWTDFHKYWR